MDPNRGGASAQEGGIILIQFYYLNRNVTATVYEGRILIKASENAISLDVPALLKLAELIEQEFGDETTARSE